MLVLACFLAISNLRADPENFMVEDITFVRPPSWEWVVPDSEVRKAHLKVFNQNKAQTADMIFYWFPTGDKQGDPEGSIKRWEAQFRERATIVATIERATIGKYKVMYCQMEGTYKGFGKESLSLPNYALVGTIIEMPRGNIMIRFTGPRELISASITTFKKMIEDALKEE